MNLCIRYFTKSKKGNTKKLSDFISNKLKLEALDVSNNLDEEVEYLILVNALYANNIDKEVFLYDLDKHEETPAYYGCCVGCTFFSIIAGPKPE